MLGDTFNKSTLDSLFIDFSVIKRKIDSHIEAIDRIQIVLPIRSLSAGFILCRDISKRPNLEILLSCILA